MEEFAEANAAAAQLLGREKAKQLLEDFHEKQKRATFTYEMGMSAMEHKAATSLDRAKRFVGEIRKIVEL